MKLTDNSKRMIRALLSICVGALVSWLVVAYANAPHEAPPAVSLYLILPIFLLVSAVNPDQAIGEILFWGILIALISAATYLLLWLLGRIWLSLGSRDKATDNSQATVSEKQTHARETNAG